MKNLLSKFFVAIRSLKFCTNIMTEKLIKKKKSYARLYSESVDI